ncbi:MAG: leucine-rich repeat domain-containing protein [Candidatus Lokiarchaeota archaeon]|nr:leucine-rich repeat domain-containing protein [Candidatus Lokiarchaeota archaeon]
MSLLSPNKIYKDFKNKKLDKKQALSLLISLIDDIHDYDDNTRIMSIKFLELLKTKDEKIFNFLENLLISDSNEQIRGQAARILIFNFPEKSLNPIIWALMHDKADSCLIQIIKSIENFSNKKLKLVLKKIKYVNFKGSIFFPSEYYPLINLNNKNIDNIGKIKNVENLTNIKKLYLNYNLITEINGLNKLNELRSLHLQGNMIKKIEGLIDLKNLESLYLNNNEISIIDGINGLPNLKLLMLFDNNISNIQELENLSNLEILNLRNNQISEIKGLRKLTNLRRLDLSNNQISEIKGLENLKKLEFLDLSHNNITEVKGLENLLKLKFLDLRNNKITKIGGLDKLTKLQHLYIGFNQISGIEEIERLKHVKVLDIKNTERSFIRKSLWDAFPQKINETNDLIKKSVEIRDIKFNPKLFGSQSIFKELSNVKEYNEYFTDSNWTIILKTNQYQTFKLSNSGKIKWLQRRKNQIIKIQ